MRLTAVREFFWPLLDPPVGTGKSSVLEEIDIDLEGDDLKLSFDLATKFYESESDRRDRVESKSIIFISSIGLMVTVALAATKDFLFNAQIQIDAIALAFIAMMIVFFIYVGRTLWFAVMCLERRGYHILHYSIFTKNDTNFLKKLTAETINITLLNRVVINEKVDHMVMAQEYFKRAIMSFSFFPALVAAKIFDRAEVLRAIQVVIGDFALYVENGYNILLIVFGFCAIVNAIIVMTFFSSSVKDILHLDNVINRRSLDKKTQQSPS